ncbi:hypothetical protein [Limnohabitans sp. G3-2]|uniref:hypothetical protein n=1 Tax=Limnohabitans sp. G3-2 TaxID=1100711 RepID=UPI000C1EC7F7|nr:hypothetical protein [Limnohabitans sp. G3-2]PIT77088.1 hypothetical protein B9Z31_03820 [Limnohabitans sp. G3-2]
MMRAGLWPQAPVLALSLWTFTAPVHAFNLVSLQEMQASQAASEAFTAKVSPVPGAPQIEVVHPKLDGPVASPTPIQLLFLPSGSSSVRPETFKVLYGRLRLDITQRLVNEAKITAEGISVKEANLPKGSHQLLLRVEDLQGRQGMKHLDIDIK